MLCRGSGDLRRPRRGSGSGRLSPGAQRGRPASLCAAAASAPRPPPSCCPARAPSPRAARRLSAALSASPQYVTWVTMPQVRASLVGASWVTDPGQTQIQTD